ncbi:hypothetical protein L1049_002955 [Liquidambar formosana]|uniref:Uncharacterized protein n=1 Tax=Liquidambar formosana TaxID=63359 RepID=A0AAP0R9F6_LIQFO
MVRHRRQGAVDSSGCRQEGFLNNSYRREKLDGSEAGRVIDSKRGLDSGVSSGRRSTAIVDEEWRQGLIGELGCVGVRDGGFNGVMADNLREGWSSGFNSVQAGHGEVE